MPRYIDADETIELLRSLGSRDYRREKGTICDAIKMLQYPEYTPTADVVPKSEYDRLEKLYNDMTQEAKGYLNKLYGIRADVAREIFEEIEEIFFVHFKPETRSALRDVYISIRELKKKYTEGDK